MTKYIYESPDKGETIYRREFGAPHDTRELIKSKKDSILVIEWSASDIMELCPSLTFDEACDVIEKLKMNYNPEIGINKQLIQETANSLV